MFSTIFALVLLCFSLAVSQFNIFIMSKTIASIMIDALTELTGMSREFADIFFTKSIYVRGHVKDLPNRFIDKYGIVLKDDLDVPDNDLYSGYKVIVSIREKEFTNAIRRFVSSMYDFNECYMDYVEKYHNFL